MLTCLAALLKIPPEFADEDCRFIIAMAGSIECTKQDLTQFN